MTEAKIEDFVIPTRTNPYTPVATALLEAGEGKSVRLTTTAGEAASVRRQFGHAANGLTPPQTAKLRDAQIDGESVAKNLEGVDDATQVDLIFTLGPKQDRPGRPRKDKDDADAPKSDKK